MINALGIRHVGETTARLMARHYRTIDAFLEGMKAENAREELESLEGIGGVVAEAIRDFFDEPHNVKALDRLLEWLDGDRRWRRRQNPRRCRARPWCSPALWKR